MAILYSNKRPSTKKNPRLVKNSRGENCGCKKISLEIDQSGFNDEQGLQAVIAYLFGIFIQKTAFKVLDLKD